VRDEAGQPAQSAGPTSPLPPDLERHRLVHGQAEERPPVRSDDSREDEEMERSEEVDYETRALRWLRSETVELTRELRKCGIDIENTRRIAGNYLFGLACRFDGSEEATGARLYFPSERELAEALDDVSLHDYVLGTVDEVVDRARG
jgi:hypothetical protein